MNKKMFLNAPELHIGIVAFFLHFAPSVSIVVAFF
jgi:hypothetical protein|tara:strand:- start:804 stop:908 length:105 start_codon:yes stop_codon:yes gene_type:complete